MHHLRRVILTYYSRPCGRQFSQLHPLAVSSRTRDQPKPSYRDTSLSSSSHETVPGPVGLLRCPPTMRTHTCRRSSGLLAGIVGAGWLQVSVCLILLLFCVFTDSGNLYGDALQLSSIITSPPSPTSTQEPWVTCYSTASGKGGGVPTVSLSSALCI